MKFLSKRNLRTKAAIILAFLLLFFSLQFIVVRWKMKSLEVLYAHGNYARETQLINQSIFLNTYLYLEGQTEISNQLVNDIDILDHHLDVIRKGGRIDGSNIFLNALPRLPQISFDELMKHWQSFRRTILTAAISEEHMHKAEIIKLLPGKWQTLSSWYNRLIQDMDESINEQRSSINWLIGLFILADILLIAAVYYYTVKGILRPVEITSDNTSKYLHTHLEQKDELGKMTLAINQVIEELKDATEFVQQIGEGKLGIDYRDLDPHYQQGRNKLADSLIDMQTKLKELNEEEKKRQWTNEGLTKFVDILRSGGDNINALGDRIIAALVQYTGANQGALYLLNDDEPYNKFLELLSLFAFDTKKHEHKRIKLGEGILGQTFLEKETTYLNKVPQEYITITSGLGGTNPKAVLIVPLKIDTVVYGIVELASFEEFKTHEISFVERLGETIASSLSNVKSAHKNKRLLEESKAAQEMMRSQEEEMRQNMEELTATQEEIARKEREYVSRIRELEAQLESGDNGEKEQLEHALITLKKESESRINQLEEKLTKKQESGSEWQLAEEVEKTLRVNLDALKIVEQQLRGPGKS